MKKEDFLDELAQLALGSRLKRLSERMGAEAGLIYKACGHHDIQPKWFGLLSLLHSRGKVSVVDASQLLGLTQPAISQFVKELVSQELVVSVPGEQDARRKFLSLTDMGAIKVEQMQPMWQAVDLAAKQLCSETRVDFYAAMQQFEKALSRRTLMQRTMAIFDNPRINPEVEIVEFKPELAERFYTINEQWISDMFALEEIDRYVLQNPQEAIIDKGGKIYFAVHPSFGVVGACALLKVDDSCFELTKMGVLAQSRGLKIGETLLQYVIEQAIRMKVENLFLLTNSDCQAAIHLYRKFGFEDDEQTMARFGSEYERCNVAMRYFK
jgi:DNA-binding MarR family transcriptional regulator/N-acetylglutamate synthase-like GNAT family acetyltransferase